MVVTGLTPTSERFSRLDQAIATWEDDGGAVTTLKGPFVATEDRVTCVDPAGPQLAQRNTDTSN